MASHKWMRHLAHHFLSQPSPFDPRRATRRVSHTTPWAGRPSQASRRIADTTPASRTPRRDLGHHAGTSDTELGGFRSEAGEPGRVLGSGWTFPSHVHTTPTLRPPAGTAGYRGGDRRDRRDLGQVPGTADKK